MDPSKVRELLVVLKEFGVTQFEQGAENDPGRLKVTLAPDLRSAPDDAHTQALQGLVDLAKRSQAT